MAPGKGRRNDNQSRLLAGNSPLLGLLPPRPAEACCSRLAKAGSMPIRAARQLATRSFWDRRRSGRQKFVVAARGPAENHEAAPAGRGCHGRLAKAGRTTIRAACWLATRHFRDFPCCSSAAWSTPSSCCSSAAWSSPSPCCSSALLPPAALRQHGHWTNIPLLFGSEVDSFLPLLLSSLADSSLLLLFGSLVNSLIMLLFGRKVGSFILPLISSIIGFRPARLPPAWPPFHRPAPMTCRSSAAW